jgi:hypothetical protein
MESNAVKESTLPIHKNFHFDVGWVLLRKQKIPPSDEEKRLDSFLRPITRHTSNRFLQCLTRNKPFHNLRLTFAILINNNRRTNKV